MIEEIFEAVPLQESVPASEGARSCGTLMFG